MAEGRKSKTVRVQSSSLVNAVVRNLYNSFVTLGILVIIFLSARAVLNNIYRVDSYLSELSPYAETGIELGPLRALGMKGRIPKPVFFQAYRDLSRVAWPIFYFLLDELKILTGDVSESLTGVRVVSVAVRPAPVSQPAASLPIINRPQGHSLLFVNSFCKEIFRPEIKLEECREKLLSNCVIDILDWFQNEPNIKQVTNCLVKEFKKEPSFFQNFTKKLGTREQPLPPVNQGNKTSTRLLCLILVVVTSVVFAVILRRVRCKLLFDNDFARAQQKAQAVENEISGRLVQLDEKNFDFHQEPETTCYDFNSSDCNSILEHELYGLCTLIVLDPLPVHQKETCLGAAGELDHDLEQSEQDQSLLPVLSTVPQFIQFPVYILEVYLSDEDSGELKLPESPPLEYLDISWQKSLLEESRVGITTIHQADFDFDVPDNEDINEENIFVTGFEVDANDPLKLNYWRKRLVEVRADLAQAALDKLKQRCPTLWNMGWFKELESSRKPSIADGEVSDIQNNEDSNPEENPGKTATEEIDQNAEDVNSCHECQEYIVSESQDEELSEVIEGCEDCKKM